MNTLIVISIIVVLYAGMVQLLHFGWSNLFPQERKSVKMLPTVSVIVAMRNEAENIDNLMNALLCQKFPKENWEIILIDDHSSDRTFVAANKYVSDSISLIKNSGKGKKQALETGASRAKGEWLLFTDADCNMGWNWLRSMADMMVAPNQLLLGPVLTRKRKGFISALQFAEFCALLGTTAGTAYFGHPVNANGGNMAIKKELFLALKPYAENRDLPTGDDIFLLQAYKQKFKSGVAFVRNREALVLTEPVTDFETYLKQRIRWTSKISRYSDWAAILTGGLTFLASLAVVLLLTVGHFRIYWLKWSLFLLAIKFIADATLIFPVARFSGQNVGPFQFLLISLLYPFTVVITVLGGLFKKTKVPQ